MVTSLDIVNLKTIIAGVRNSPKLSDATMLMFNAGEKNYLTCHVIFMISNAGKKTFQIFHVRRQTSNVSKIGCHKLLAGFLIWSAGKDMSKTSLRRVRGRLSKVSYLLLKNGLLTGFIN